MRRAVLVVLLGILGCATPLKSRIKVIHDDERDVTCWLVPEVGIACVPDWRIERPDPDFAEKGTVTIAAGTR